MSEAAAAAGGGSLGVVSGYRSFQTQVSTYASNVANGGKAAADATSAHPGYSEHQTGFATDVVSCTSAGCGTMDGFGTSAAGKWVAENGWRYGFIVRYEPGQTAVAGYDSEPWHLRYIVLRTARRAELPRVTGPATRGIRHRSSCRSRRAARARRVASSARIASVDTSDGRSPSSHSRSTAAAGDVVAASEASRARS